MANRYWVGNGGDWSDNTNHWSASSGGAGGASLPTSSDDVFFDANSFSAGSQTVTIDVTAYCLNMDWTGATDTPTLAGGLASHIYGSLTLIAGMTVTQSGYLYFRATSGTHTITTANLPSLPIINIYGIGGTFFLAIWMLFTVLSSVNKIITCKLR